MAQEIINVKELTDAELGSELESAQAEYQRMQFEHALKGLANPLVLRAMRRDIARINTEIRSRQVSAMTPEQLADRSRIRARRAKR